LTLSVEHTSMLLSCAAWHSV